MQNGHLANIDTECKRAISEDGMIAPLEIFKQ